jgi:hypothetical protein
MRNFSIAGVNRSLMSETFGAAVFAARFGREIARDDGVAFRFDFGDITRRDDFPLTAIPKHSAKGLHRIIDRGTAKSNRAGKAGHGRYQKVKKNHT